MRFVRTISGVLLLTFGLAVTLVGGALWTLAGQRDADGAFRASLERVDTTGHAIVVPDLDALLRRDAPFTRTGQARLRITAGTGAGPAFLGLAPAAAAERYLAAMPYAQLDRVGVTRGRLPVQVTAVAGSAAPGDLAGATPGAVAPPAEQPFWVRQGTNALDLAMADLRGQRLSLVIMYPDARAGVAVDLRAQLRIGWLDPTAWGLLAGGTLFAVLGVIMLVWPVRPREVVFVVEPGQLPVLTARLGIRALADLGQPRSAAATSTAPAATIAPAQPTAPAEAIAPAPAPTGWPAHSHLPAPSRPVDLATAALTNAGTSREADPVSAGPMSGVVAGSTAARPATLADVLAQESLASAGASASVEGIASVEGAASAEASASVEGGASVERGGSAIGEVVDRLWPAAIPPPVKLVLNWPPRSTGSTSPVSRPPANRAPDYPTQTSPIRSAQPEPPQPDPVHPDPVQPDPTRPELPQPDPVHPEPVQVSNPVPAYAGKSGSAQPVQPGPVESTVPGSAEAGRTAAVEPVETAPVAAVAVAPAASVVPVAKPASAQPAPAPRARSVATAGGRAAATRPKKCKTEIMGSDGQQSPTANNMPSVRSTPARPLTETESATVTAPPDRD
jgi:hypothetical protein